MKVIGTGAPRMLTIRLRPCEVGVLRDELRERRAIITEAAVRAHAECRAPNGDHGDADVEDHHDELLLISLLLDDLQKPRPSDQAREIVGPTWLLGQVIREAAYSAVERFAEAVSAFRNNLGSPPPAELRAALETASAWTATLIGLDHAENYAVD